MSETATIVIKIRATAIERGETFLMDAVLNGLRATGYSEISLSCVAVEIIDGPQDIPALLLPGFVDFAEKLLASHPDYGFFADLDNGFYRSLLMAQSGTITAVKKKGKTGRVLIDGDRYLFQAMSEVDRVLKIGVDHNVNSLVMDIHGEDLTAYLISQEVD
jgi:hypothetical protein